MIKEIERTWAEIDLGAITDNYRAMRAALKPETKFLGVVKADAYGHGAAEIARVLQECGCDYLAVAALSEAAALREAGISLPILILGYTAPENTETLINYGITQSVSALTPAREMSERAERLGKKLRVHLALDSGMGRFGAVCHGGRDATGEYAEILRLPGLEAEGIFTHFAVSDEPDGEAFTKMQYEAFTAQISRLEGISGHKFKIRHCVNSGAMVNCKEMQLDMVRPGVALYGCYPGAEEKGLFLRETMELKTRIAQIKELLPGDTVSYGRTWTAQRDCTIAVLPIGYADGLQRCLSGKLEVLLRGVRVKQVGRICMDLCMVDVTDVPEVQPGDVATIFGIGQDGSPTAAELADWADTIPYEILCAVSPRVPRIYTE